MIKINGPNCYQGDGDYYLFGYLLNGDGSGKGINSWYFSYNFGNEWGDGCYFGDEIGDGGSWNSNNLKEEFKK